MILFKYLRFFAPFMTLGTVLLSLLIVFNTLIYFQAGPTPVFLLEKGALRHDQLWSTAFYSHISSACICLLVGAPLMIPAMLRFRRIHMVLGYVYLNAVLWVAAPTGLMISPFAKGGWLSAVGFLVTGIAWWWTTWLGYRAIRPGAGRKPDVAAHIRWMIRSYAIALSAIAFRLIQLGLFYLYVDDITNYVASVWLSLGVSVLLSELCIRFTSATSTRRRVPQLTPSSRIEAVSDNSHSRFFVSSISSFSNEGVNS